MNLQKLERTVIVTIGARLTLVGIALANFDKASWAFGQWSETAAWQADVMAASIEGALVIFTYMLAQRLIANATKMKSDPVQPTNLLWGFVVFLSVLSAICNSLYFTHFGRLANPLHNLQWTTTAGIFLGIAAPLLVGGIAYLQGEEAATEVAVREAERKREEIRQKAEETRERNRKERAEAEAGATAEAEIKEQRSKFSQWSSPAERRDAIVQCVRESDPEREGVARERVFELVFDGHEESDSTKYSDVSGLIKTGRLEKVGGLITWPQASVTSF